MSTSYKEFINVNGVSVAKRFEDYVRRFHENTPQGVRLAAHTTINEMAEAMIISKQDRDYLVQVLYNQKGVKST